MDLQIQLNVINGGGEKWMKELNNNELNMIIGGSISGTLISSIVRGAETLFELGRSLGSAIRRFVSKQFC